MVNDQDRPMLLGYAAQIVSAHVSRNAVPAHELSTLIEKVYQALSTAGLAPIAADPERPEPAVPIRNSVFADYLICLEDGKKLKMLKRHLKTVHNMTPDAYRRRWGLPPDYPMVAPSYAQRRSALAQQIGLGTHRTATTDEPQNERPRTRAAGRKGPVARRREREATTS